MQSSVIDKSVGKVPNHLSMSVSGKILSKNKDNCLNKGLSNSFVDTLGKTVGGLTSLTFFEMSVTSAHFRNEAKSSKHSLREKCPKTEFLLVRIFLHSD